MPPSDRRASPDRNAATRSSGTARADAARACRRATHDGSRRIRDPLGSRAMSCHESAAGSGRLDSPSAENTATVSCPRLARPSNTGRTALTDRLGSIRRRMAHLTPGPWSAGRRAPRPRASRPGARSRVPRFVSVDDTAVRHRFQAVEKARRRAHRETSEARRGDAVERASRTGSARAVGSLDPDQAPSIVHRRH